MIGNIIVNSVQQTPPAQVSSSAPDQTPQISGVSFHVLNNIYIYFNN